ncbi:tRNA (guanosine(46)-N7)-methyltransferase TrmB [Rhodobacteraceae bacterium 2CG4]|uniref:tRNA (guanine-N(7)-)-methyltransferase n=1 Tax=Halovulum marinum TaxID=2662447 RepID=A0A6L5Z878_9RHOB|nr:tRNA (guanosine(46)-N7)-methyltransferase TrmB [Halovulum marinum]MSU92304.1 tRNA (guanosine(46)-N7)-methyltransferase TrmB [Halovulum marinum]
MNDQDHIPPHPDGAPLREDGAPWRNFYGRRKGKALRPGQIEHIERTLPRLAVPNVGWDENPERRALDPQALFGRRAPLVLEIGFGGGEHLLAQAAARPEADFIGCETFVNGVAMLLPRLDSAGLTNVRVHMGDARDLLDVLPEAALDAVYLLYPDPWPKKKHRRRRFVNPDTLGPLARTLRPGGRFRIATDIPDYVRHSLEKLHAAPEFAWTAERPGDWRSPWPGWHRTRYEAKALRQGRTPTYLDLIRR